MIKSMPHYVLFSALLGLTVGCNDSEVNNSNQRNSSTSIEHTVLFSDNSGDGFGRSAAKRSVVISDQASYETEAAEYGIMSSLPPVDFTTSQVVLIDAGQKGGGEHDVTIVDAFTDSDSTIVEVDFTSSAENENCRLAPVVTQPFLFAAIKSRSDIMFSERINITFCDQ